MYRAVEGNTTRLRPASWGFSDDELRRRYRWSLDENLQYWSGTIPGGRSFAHFCETVAQRDWPRDGKRISYAILSKSEELLGMVSCYNIDQRSRTGELGIYLGDKETWGHGYGSDALIVFLRHLFTDLNFESVYLHTYESNTRAQRSYLTVGFEQVEKRRRFSPRVGYHQEVKMSIARGRFERLHGLAEVAAMQ
jgi:RimJ/RimL family protein N-acetyltransferase